MGERARAVEALKRAVKLDPSEGQARAQLAKWGALDDETDRTARLDDAYVGGLFDQFAASFDETLVEKLGYRGHLQCAAVLSKALEDVELGSDVVVVDLGAGTGLCGAPLRRVLAPKTPHITAVDLSTRMLELCATRGDHDAVVEGEAVEHLRRLPADSVDIIVAADVLAYIGDCAELIWRSSPGPANKREVGVHARGGPTPASAWARAAASSTRRRICTKRRRRRGCASWPWTGDRCVLKEGLRWSR